jgi:hypothetical protein
VIDQNQTHFRKASSLKLQWSVFFSPEIRNKSDAAIRLHHLLRKAFSDLGPASLDADHCAHETPCTTKPDSNFLVLYLGFRCYCNRNCGGHKKTAFPCGETRLVMYVAHCTQASYLL